MKKYILVPFKEYQKQQEQIPNHHHQSRKEVNSLSGEIRKNGKENIGADDVDVGVQRPKNKKEKTDIVVNKKRKSEEVQENLDSETSAYQMPGTVNWSNSSAEKKKLSQEEEEKVSENGYPGKATRKFWIRP